MEFLKITAGLLLLVQVSHLARIHHTTDSPGRTIPQSWLRELAKNTAGRQNAAVPVEETELDPRTDGTAGESSGIASGSMGFFNEEEEGNVSGRDKGANEGSDDLPVVTTTTVPSAIQNVTTELPEFPDTNVSQANATTDLTNSGQINMTDAEEEFNNSSSTPQNSTTPLSAQNSTSIPDHSNHTDLHTTASAPDGNATHDSTTKPDEDTWLTNATGPKNTIATTTTTPEITETTTMSSSTTVFSSETTETSPTTTIMAAPITPEMANKTEKGSGAGSSSERGLDSEHRRNGRNGAWGAVLGTAVAVAVVGLVAYVILRRRHQKGFSHRKLVEEFPSDPVHRLDNSEPLDLNFGGSAYYNPGLQGDNIQMSSIPGRQ